MATTRHGRNCYVKEVLFFIMWKAGFFRNLSSRDLEQNLVFRNNGIVIKERLSPFYRKYFEQRTQSKASSL